MAGALHICVLLLHQIILSKSRTAPIPNAHSRHVFYFKTSPSLGRMVVGTRCSGYGGDGPWACAIRRRRPVWSTRYAFDRKWSAANPGWLCPARLVSIHKSHKKKTLIKDEVLLNIHVIYFPSWIQHSFVSLRVLPSRFSHPTHDGSVARTARAGHEILEAIFRRKP